MNKTPARRSSLFLLEFMIALLFFILTCTICTRLFVKAHTISQNAENLNIAVQQTASYAERFRAGESFPEFSCIYYNEAWEICPETDMHFCLIIQTEHNGPRKSAVFQMTETNKEEIIYEIALNTYEPTEGNVP